MSLCSRTQTRISAALDDDTEIPHAAQQHLGNCQTCSDFLTNALSLEAHLTSSHGPDPAPWLHTKIMANVRDSDPVADPSPRWLPATIGAAAIGIAIAAIAISTQPADPETAESTPDTTISAPMTPVHPAAITRDIEQHAKLALGKEFRDIAADISGARDFFSASLRRTIPGFASD